MLKKEFLIMMHQDLETKHDEMLNALLECFEEILKNYPNNIEIDSNKNVEDCYKKMKEHAQKNKVNGSYCFTPSKTKEFVISYLDLKDITTNSNIIKLEDFI